MYAIIDIGSNTIRLNVYQVEEDGAIHSIFQSKETAGLAGYVQEDGSMSREGLDRAADALLRFRSILDALHIENRAVFATASLRNITNSEEAVFQLQERTGLMIRLLSGRRKPSWTMWEPPPAWRSGSRAWCWTSAAAPPSGSASLRAGYATPPPSPWAP